METRLRSWDVVVPVAILAIGVLELATAHPDGWGWGVVLESVTAALLVWRRRWPLVTCTVSAVVMLWMPWAGPQLNDVATPILFLALLCYSLGRWIDDLRGVVGLGVLLAMFLVDYLLVDTRSHSFGDVVFVCTLVVPPYVFGRIVRRLDEQGRLIARQADQLRDRAVREERDRIARELHDVVAHSLSAMVVQTAAAQDLVRRDPDRAAGLLQAVADTGRAALQETGRLLHLVRDDSDELGLSPAPGLAQLPALVESFRGSGLEVDATLAPAAGALPGGVDVSAYRVVQELLTNALKHGAGSVRLEVVAGGGTLRISCANPLGRSAGEGSGLGLQGVAERVSVLGGRLDPRCSDGSFVVDVEIPLPAGAGA